MAGSYLTLGTNPPKHCLSVNVAVGKFLELGGLGSRRPERGKELDKTGQKASSRGTWEEGSGRLCRGRLA